MAMRLHAHHGAWGECRHAPGGGCAGTARPPHALGTMGRHTLYSTHLERLVTVVSSMGGELNAVLGRGVNARHAEDECMHPMHT